MSLKLVLWVARVVTLSIDFMNGFNHTEPAFFRVHRSTLFPETAKPIVVKRGFDRASTYPLISRFFHYVDLFTIGQPFYLQSNITVVSQHFKAEQQHAKRYLSTIIEDWRWINMQAIFLQRPARAYVY